MEHWEVVGLEHLNKEQFEHLFTNPSGELIGYLFDAIQRSKQKNNLIVERTNRIQMDMTYPRHIKDCIDLAKQLTVSEKGRKLLKLLEEFEPEFKAYIKSKNRLAREIAELALKPVSEINTPETDPSKAIG